MNGNAQSAELVTEPSALAPFEAEWRELVELRGNAFVSPQWCFSWLQHASGRARPWVIVVRSGAGGVRGVLPLVLSGSRLRVLQFPGGKLGDYFHPAAKGEDEDAVAGAAAAILARHRSDWRILVLRNVDAQAAWPSQLVAASSGRLALLEGESDVLPHIELHGQTWESYLSTRSRSFRSSLGRELRVLQRDHEVRFRRTLTSSELETDMSTFFALHAKRWEGRGLSTIMSPEAQATLRAFAARALSTGWLRLWFVELDGQAVASWYGWRLGDRYAHYQSGLDPAWSRRSVGLVLLAHTIKQAIAEGAAHYDMLAGGEAYKRRLATGERYAQTLVLVPARHPVRLIAASEIALRRTARRLPAGSLERLRAWVGRGRRSTRRAAPRGGSGPTAAG